MVSVKKRAIVCVCIVLSVLCILSVWIKCSSGSREGRSEAEIERCIVENDHRKLSSLLQNESSRKYFHSRELENAFETAMERGHIEVIQEIAKYEDLRDIAINKKSVKVAIDSGHVHIVKYILSDSSLQNIIFKHQELLSAISDSEKLMRECITDGVIAGLLRSDDDAVKCVLSNPVIRKRVSAWAIAYLTKPQNKEDISPLIWRVVGKEDIKKLLEECTAEQVADILEFPGAAEVFGARGLPYMLTTEHGREALKGAFTENRHGELGAVAARSVKSMRSAYIKLVELLVGAEKLPDGDSLPSYEAMCKLSTDSTGDGKEEAAIEHLSKLPGLARKDVASVYTQILFRRKVSSDRDEFRELPQSVLESLHECFGKEEAETCVELTARRLTKKNELIPLNTHEFYMLYGESRGRYLKSDGLIRNCLYDNHCAICRKSLVDEKPREEEDVEVPVCPVCENEYDANAECSRTNFKVPACGHAFHSRCLEEWAETDVFDNECPYESCQKPVFPGLSEEDVLQMRQRGVARKYASEIKELENKIFFEMMQNLEFRIALIQKKIYFRASESEVERLIRLMLLKDILGEYRKKIIMEDDIYREVERCVGFSERELFLLKIKYPWIRE